MTTGLKTPSSYYIELINEFPPRPISTEAELVATQTRIHSILDKPSLTQDDRDYLKVLGTLVYDYEEQHEPIPNLRGIELLKALMEEANLQPQDLVPIFGNQDVVISLLSHESQLTENQANNLAAFFKVSSASFV